MIINVRDFINPAVCEAAVVSRLKAQLEDFIRLEQMHGSTREGDRWVPS